MNDLGELNANVDFFF